jgi:prophage regulatory protein
MIEGTRAVAEQIDRSRDRILRLPEVRDRCGGLHRATIYRKIGAGSFPAPVKLGQRSVGWYEADINAWVADPR